MLDAKYDIKTTPTWGAVQTAKAEFTAANNSPNTSEAQKQAKRQEYLTLINICIGELKAGLR